MDLPTKSNIHLPLLKTLEENGGSLAIADAIVKTKEKYPRLTEEAKASTLGSGQNRLNNRIEWARLDLVHSGDMDGSKTGIWIITERGKSRLKKEWNSWKAEYIELKERGISNAKNKKEEQIIYSGESPNEVLDQSINEIIESVKIQLLDSLKKVDPSNFENIVAQLLEKLQYGSLNDGSIKITGRSGDGGIDGTCSMDKLGLFKVLFQAKRWTNNVTPHDVRDFIGALHNARATYGVFITTSNFSNDAKQEAAKAGNVKLINGEELAKLMINSGLGIRVSSFSIPKFDQDYFDGLI
jgi:restriction system protein